MTNQMTVTSEQAVAENWEPQDGFSELPCVCVNDHQFYSHAKFSGKLVRIVSRKPCPVCGEHALRSYSSGGYEKMTITKKEAGNIDE